MVHLTQDDLELIHLRKLSTSMARMKENQAKTDVTLFCGKDEFPVHRLILSAASPYFRCLFSNEWEDVGCERHDLSVWTPNTIDAILSFVYTGRLKCDRILEDKEAMIGLLEAADYFQIDHLVDYCFQTIFGLTLTVTNFLEIYSLTERFNSSQHTLSIENLLSSKFNEMSKSEEFLYLSPAQLKRILQHPNINYNNLDEALSILLKWTQFENQRSVFLEEFMEILNLFSCLECLNCCVMENISMSVWNLTITNLLKEMSVRRCTPLMVCPLSNNNSLVVCFGKKIMQIYNVKNSKWMPTKEIPFNIAKGATMVAYRGHIFIFGNSLVPKSTEVTQYCPFANNVVHGVSELLFGVAFPGASVFSDSIYIANGSNKLPALVRMVQRYDPDRRTSHQVASTLKEHYRPFMFSFGDHLHISSSTYDTDFSSVFADDKGRSDISVECYDTIADQWTELLYRRQNFDFRYFKDFTVIGTKLFCSLRGVCCPKGCNKFYTLDLVSEEEEILVFDTESDLSGMTAIKENGKAFLLAFDSERAPHLYDAEAGLWVKKTSGTVLLDTVHMLPCCI